MLLPVHWPSITENGRVESWELNVARGLVKNHTSLNIAGYQSSVGSTFIPIWENATAYVYPSNGTMLLWSSSGSDTNVLIQINGLDSDYNQISENLLLTNGTTGVETVNAYKRIQGINVIDGVNSVGVISLGNNAKTETYAKIAAGAGTSAMSIYTVPAGHTFYLAKVNAYTHQGNNQQANYRSYTINSSGIIRAVLQVPFDGLYISQKTIPRPYTEKTDCQWQCNSSSTSDIGIQIEGVLIKNDTP
jgi:hypothetical protein